MCLCTCLLSMYMYMCLCTFVLSMYMYTEYVHCICVYVHCICVVSQMIPNAKVSTDSCGSSNNCTHIAKVSTEVSSTLIQT